MRAHYLQHVPFEGLGSIESWLEQQGYTISRTAFFDNPTLPALDNLDFLIAMGGPMSVNDEADYPWLIQEKAFIREFIATGKPVLGICLGAQLIANALGAAVYPNTYKEIGWLPIESVENQAEAFQFPDTLPVFHWHGETFDLPEQAVRLARSIACENQAFQVERRVMGLQFHLESTPESVQAIVSHCADELVSAPYIQDAQRILSAPPQQYQRINQLMREILAYLTQN